MFFDPPTPDTLHVVASGVRGGTFRAACIAVSRFLGRPGASLLKIWTLAISCPVGIAIVHEGISAETMANIYYELGWMQAYGRETIVIKVGDIRLPSDFVRTEYILFDGEFNARIKAFIDSLSERAEYYFVLANQLEKNPLLAIDYLRRSYLLSGDEHLKQKVSADIVVVYCHARHVT